MFAVTTPSAYRNHHNCFLGSGPTKAAALEDAFGPKSDWTSYTRRLIKQADVSEVTEDELHELRCRN